MEHAGCGRAVRTQSSSSGLTADAAAERLARTGPNVLFLGTHVVSGSGRALVVHTGRSTEFGATAGVLDGLRQHLNFLRKLAHRSEEQYDRSRDLRRRSCRSRPQGCETRRPPHGVPVRRPLRVSHRRTHGL
ncbi:MAG: cation-transporting P-type ATPase [Pyrinomonadaceae bacterium]